MASRYRTQDEFLEKAIAVHGDTYDYSLTKYQSTKIKITIICKEHGEFMQAPNAHLQKQGCPKCGILKAANSIKSSTPAFIDKAKTVHGDKYDYSLADYQGKGKKVAIICLQHGVFHQDPINHTQGQGCPQCARLTSGRRSSLDQFIDKAKQIHGDKYDYSLVSYKNNRTKVDIICKTHGVFQQIPDSHVQGNGCSACGYLANSARFRMSSDDFIAKAVARHGDKYDYSNVDYSTSTQKIEIICKVHGSFFQIPADHLIGTNCPSCRTTHSISSGETELHEYLSSMVTVSQTDRRIIPPFEIDSYIPSHKLGIEYCGVYYHSDKYKEKDYHLVKLNAAMKAGVELIQIFDDEWLDKKDIVKSILANRLGKIERKLHGRKTVIKEVSESEAKSFLNDNHIQGFVSAPIRIGLYHYDELVQLATFSGNRPAVGKLKEGWFELVRLCSKQHTSVIGGFSKLLKAFIEQYHPVGIKTYCDKRFFNGKGYESVGFVAVRHTVPQYYYIKSQSRFSRYLFQKHKLAKKLKNYDPALSESANMKAHNYHRVYDCGLIVYEMKI